MHPGFLSPFGHRRWLLGPSCSRQGMGLPCGRLTGSPDPGGVATFHTRELRPGWVPPIPRAAVFPRVAGLPHPAPAASQRPALHPGAAIHLRGHT